MLKEDMENLQRLIVSHQCRLQVLKEQKALQGLSVDPKIPLEIQDIEEEIEHLQLELKELQAQEIKGLVLEDNLKKIQIVVQVNDITTIDVDVVALKFAQALYGADEVVASELGKSESDIQRVLPTVGQYKLFFANGRIKARQVLFFSVVDLYLFGKSKGRFNHSFTRR